MRATKKQIYAKYNIEYANGKINSPICRCGIDENQHCAGCHKCSECEYVLFVEHSTEYVATDDPRYAELVELVETQDK